MTVVTRRIAFTLIELLVVIAIVTLLAALLLPSLQRTRIKAKTADCRGHLKQITLATLMYAQDYQESFPRTGYPPWAPTYDTVSWASQLLPYVGGNRSVFLCPNDPRKPPGVTCGYANSNQLGCKTFPGMGGCSPAKLSEVPHPSQVIMWIDSDYDSVNPLETNDFTSIFWAPPVYYGTRDSGGVNISFVDGHVGWYKITYDDSTNQQGISFSYLY